MLKVNPSWEMAEQFLVEQQQSVFIVDALSNTTPLNHRVDSPTEISSHFGSISYNKGMSYQTSTCALCYNFVFFTKVVV